MIASTLWALNASRAWIVGSWLYIPLTLGTQLLLIPFVDFSTVAGVLTFNLFSALPSLLLNIGLSFHGFRQPDPGMKLPNFGYHFARWEGDLRRKSYRALLPAIVQRTIQPPRDIPLDVYSYSGEAMLPEQVRSIRSFLRHVGRPKSFTVVSDGSHTRQQHRTSAKNRPGRLGPAHRRKIARRICRRSFAITSPLIRWVNSSA